jgi:hypothetical protein
MRPAREQVDGGQCRYHEHPFLFVDCHMFNKVTLFFAAITVVLVSGCGSFPQSTGIMQMSPETYKIVYRSAFGRGIKSQGDAMEMVKSFCDEKHLQVQIISSRTLGLMNGDSDLEGSFEAQFKCVK